MFQGESGGSQGDSRQRVFYSQWSCTKNEHIDADRLWVWTRLSSSGCDVLYLTAQSNTWNQPINKPQAELIPIFFFAVLFGGQVGQSLELCNSTAMCNSWSAAISFIFKHPSIFSLLSNVLITRAHWICTFHARVCGWALKLILPHRTLFTWG